MSGRALIVIGLILAAVLGYFALEVSPQEAADAAGREIGGTLVQVEVPERLSAEAQAGKENFEVFCAQCHGPSAAGREGAGPPLIHKVYEPSHHGDLAFAMAAMQGVRAHHWNFGDMPPVEGVTEGQIAEIVAYVRELQRNNGIN